MTNAGLVMLNFVRIYIGDSTLRLESLELSKCVGQL
jgi:hypothetical protein